MNKELYSGISIFSHLVNVHPEVVDEDEQVLSVSELDAVLNEIFTIDSVTGMPNGDIQYYLSKDGNPAVKEWLEKNLLAPRAVSSGSSIEDVTDDLINEMSRKKEESAEEYISRLASIRDTAVNNSNI